MHISSSGTVFASRPKTDAASSLFPIACPLPGGRWLVGMRLAPAKNCRVGDAYVCWSDDQGGSWTEPRPVAAPIEVDGRPGCWRAAACTPLGGDRVLAVLCWEERSNPLRPMFNEATEGLVDMKLFTAVSDDAGETWSDPAAVDCGRYRDVPTPITGPALVFPDGRWAVQFEVNKHYEDITPWQHASALVFSNDEGRTWGDVVITHSDPDRRVFCWDQRPALLADGVAMDLFWTFDRGVATYRPIHASVSRDGGRTWSEVWDTGVNQQPARPVALGDGGTLMVCVDRTDEPAIKARRSDDLGRTWPAESEIVIAGPKLAAQSRDKAGMQDAWDEMSQFSLGLPDATPLPDGGALVVYYTGERPDYTGIDWARVSL